HLDLPSTEALLAAIDDFPGAVIMVTHSEMTLRHFAGRLIVFDRAAAVLYEGGYDDFLRRGGWSGEEEPREQAAPSSGERREQRRVRAEMVARRSRELRPLERRIAEIETRIIELEELIKEEDAQIVQAAQSKAGSEVGELMRLRAAQQEEIEMLFSELEEKSAGLSEAQRRFADEFSALDH
ncbi:MAG TPA: hypothetical protein PLP17_12100, partial [Oligoflexia bacterium]|nr:hypothetical protein [Oligoflexia bacterium]